MSIKSKVAAALVAIESQARRSERDGELGEVRGLKAAALELRKLFRAGDLDPQDDPKAAPREILAVFWDSSIAKGAADYEAGRVFGGPNPRRTNVRVVHEKIRAEATWRWGWVVVADAVKANDPGGGVVMRSKDVVGKRIVRVVQGNYQRGSNGFPSGCTLDSLVFEDGTRLDLRAHEAENTGPWVEGVVRGVPEAKPSARSRERTERRIDENTAFTEDNLDEPEESR